MNVPLTDLPQMKLEDADTVITYNDAANIAVRDPGWILPPGSPPLESIGIYGKPSLTRILYLGVGVRNDWDVPIGGEVWINELRLRSRRDLRRYRFL